MINKRQAQLNSLQEQVRANNAWVKGVFDANDAAGKIEDADQMKAISAKNAETTQLLEQIGELKAVMGIHDAVSADSSPVAGNSPGHSTGRAEAQNMVKSLGELFTEDVKIQEYFKGLGNISLTKQLIQSPRLEINGNLLRSQFDPQEFIKTLVTGASGARTNTSTSGGALVFPEFLPIVDQFYQRPLTIRDLVTNGRTGSDTVVWVKITSVTNNAAETAEAANITDGDSSGRKPESAMAFEQESTTVKTIAHWLPVTTRALQDALQLRSYIDQFLRYGIEERVEDQILNGGGTGEDLTGILNTTDILEQVFTTDLFISTRKARTKVRVEGRSRATAYVMHPNDVETLDLSREATGSGANTGAFFYGGPQGMNGRRTLWGLPVVESEAIAEGTALIGDFKQAMLWDKMESSISVSNSHNDFFIRNLVAILAETRLAFAVIRPQAFCSVEVQDPS